MKVTKVFTPVSIVIDIETEKELKLLRELAGAEHSVARVALLDSEYSDSEESHAQLAEMLSVLFRGIL